MTAIELSGDYHADCDFLIAKIDNLQHRTEQLTRTAETLLSVLKRGDDPAAAMYQLEEVLSDVP